MPLGMSAGEAPLPSMGAVCVPPPGSTLNAHTLRVAPVQTPEQRLAAAQVVCRSLCEELLGQPWASYPNQREALDLVLRAWLTVAAWEGERVIAAASVHRPDPHRARVEGTRFGLPFERVARVQPGAFAGAKLVHGNHAFCHRAWRGQGILDRILMQLLAASSDAQVVTLASTGSQDPARVMGMWEALGGGDSDAARRLCARDPSASILGTRATPGPLPWLIDYYRRMGFELAGEPVFLDAYGVFAMPMVRPSAV